MQHKKFERDTDRSGNIKVSSTFSITWLHHGLIFATSPGRVVLKLIAGTLADIRDVESGYWC